MDKEEVLKGLKELNEKYGVWSYDIPLGHDIWTKGKQKIPHTRLKRIIQLASDISQKPLESCRVLDLGCLDGIFSIEFAMAGSETVGIEIREDNIQKAVFCKNALGLNNLTFSKDDARNISSEKYGEFDVILCSGLLYHLTEIDASDLIKKMHSMARIVIIDTHIALNPDVKCEIEGAEYWGWIYKEHSKNSSQEKKAKSLWASWDNNYSFWFTRASLLNLLNFSGFTSVYECFTPIHKNFGKGGMESLDRCTFVAINGEKKLIKTSPEANNLREKWEEGELNYFGKNRSKKKSVVKNIIEKLRVN